MKPSTWWARGLQALRNEWRHLVTINSTDRVWLLPLAAVINSGIPLLIGAYFDRMDYGLGAMLGGLSFLYLPATPMQHRMVWVMTSAFGMTACYALGLMSHFLAGLMLPALVFMAMLVTMICRYYRVGPPGSLFFIMAAAIGAYSPVTLETLPSMVGVFSMGSVLACIIGFFYSLVVLRLHAPHPVPPAQPASFDFVVLDAVVIGLFVGLSLALAQMLQLERPYWVPVSCLAVIQGASLRAIWNRQLQRILGTVFGLMLAWGLLALRLNPWTVSLAMMALTFAIEMLVVRHYGLAIIFITPLTLLLAEAANLGQADPGLLIHARLVDTVLGSVVGLLGGVCLHSPEFRRVAGQWLRRAVPARLRV